MNDWGYANIGFVVDVLDAGRTVQVTGFIPALVDIVLPVRVRLGDPNSKPLSTRQIERYTASCKADLFLILCPKSVPEV